uniref:Uncharacterized protein n=1 Tax=Strongyloides venezuelensis TaxID=75913 RepID=A0A0K0FGE1_STRVS
MDRSIVMITKKGIVNVNYTVWEDLKIMYLSSDILFDQIFKFVFTNSSISNPITITQDDITYGKIDNLSEWKVFMIKQHPVNRFLDVYMRFCQKYREKNAVKCLNCFADLNCIISRVYEVIEKKSRNVMNKLYYEDYFFPYTWKFSPIEGVDINIIDMENDNQMKFRIGKELIHFNISNNIIKDTFNIISNFSKSYTERKKNIRRKLNRESLYYSKVLLRKFSSMYFCDFIYFGFDIPQFKKLMYF